jgi:hypothetical protein
MPFGGRGYAQGIHLDIYCGALCMQQSSQDPQQVIVADQPKPILLRTVFQQIEAQQWVDGWREALNKNVSSSDAAMEEKFEQFLKYFTEKAKQAQEAQFTYVPSIGTKWS